VSDHPLGQIAGYVGLAAGATAVLTWLQSRTLTTDVFVVAGVVLAVLVSGWGIREAVRKPSAGTVVLAVVATAAGLLAGVLALAGSPSLLASYGSIAIVGGIAAWVFERFDRFEAEHTTCPHCSERIKATASRCKHCREEVNPVHEQVGQEA
jgi:hypothetical protein